jgi:hypothetical protein
LFEVSVAVQVTVVTPRGNCEPDGGTHTTLAPEQLSDAVGVEKFTAFDASPALVVFVVMLEGQAIEGAVMSLTVTLKEH